MSFVDFLHDHRGAAAAIAVIGILAFCGGLVWLAHWVDGKDARRSAREFEAARLARERGYGAEFFAEDLHAFRETGDDEFRARWDDSTSNYLDELNAKFDALLQGMPMHDDDAMPASYWPVVAPITGAPTTQTGIMELAEFAGPAGGLALIEHENARAPQYPVRVAHLWTTGAYATVPAPAAPVPPVDTPHLRGRHNRRR